MRSIVVAAACLLAAPAMAEPLPKPTCMSLERLQAGRRGDTTLLPLTRPQFLFAEGVSAGSPVTPPGIPLADGALLFRKDGAKDGHIIWTWGRLACGAMEAPEALIDMLAKIKTGTTDGEDL